MKNLYQLNAAGGFAAHISVPDTAVQYYLDRGYVLDAPDDAPAIPAELEPAQVAVSHEMLRDRLAAIRYAVEISGTQTPEGVRVLTGRDDQMMTLSALTTLREGYVAEIRWKWADGWQTMDAVGLAPIARACALHVQRCFTAESVVAAQIGALSDVELEGFDLQAAWVAAINQ